ncbi:hypothetical protein BKA57DRAFT_452620 [Linnemannia elongata]|nr:hypothetical protein BKA57DRAFT_452620 [Linnemannia elongata]
MDLRLVFLLSSAPVPFLSCPPTFLPTSYPFLFRSCTCLYLSVIPSSLCLFCASSLPLIPVFFLTPLL